MKIPKTNPHGESVKSPKEKKPSPVKSPKTNPPENRGKSPKKKKPVTSSKKKGTKLHPVELKRCSKRLVSDGYFSGIE